MRVFIELSFDGNAYHGWQKQPNGITVQEELESALSLFTGTEMSVMGCGRTDAGVHGLAQVAHCDLDKDWEPFRLSEALNFHMKPAPVSIVDCARVNDEWHARFSALERQYFFRLLVRRAPCGHQAGLVWQVSNPLDIEAMREGAAHFIGQHDFTTFRSSICQAKSPVKNLDILDIEQVDTRWGPELHFHVRARSFLHNQVRSIVGTLERVGAGT